ncbi:MAG: LarC family nickel insertion protein [Candidatus Latescibacteria bacterium]|nr:LarC family nickel insertion protein [Candidatus Latescibacterota bacterium]
MRIAYFDCFSGISGDMILGALVDAGLDFDQLRNELSKLPVSGFRLERRTVRKHEIVGTKIDVIVQSQDGHDYVEKPGDDIGAVGMPDHHEAHHPHNHEQGDTRHLSDLTDIINASSLDASIRRRSCDIFEQLASAEARMHGVPKEEVHLHEVSGLDAVVDIVGSCIALRLMEIDKVYFSALPLGSGFIRCAHGRLPVPAPGALELLRGVPVYQTETRGELVTPTGAAIVKETATGYGVMPRMVLYQIGYGAGTKDFEEHPNLLRVCLGVR